MFSISVATTSDESGNQMAAAIAEDDEAKAEEVEVDVDGEKTKGSDLFVFPVTV